MNTDLKQNKLYLPSSPALWLEREYAISSSALPSLEEMLDQIGPLPKTSLFFGQAEDELPILLDLSNPGPGPILISGDAGAGKTRLLRVLTRFIVSMHQPEEMQYGVITSCPQEWEDLVNFPHCVGIFPVQANSAANFVRALALWIGMQKTSRQFVLLMIDGIDEFTRLNRVAGDDIHNLLCDGPARRIWPIVTIDPSHSEFASRWLTYFHTRVSGYTSHPNIFEDADVPLADSEALVKGTEFSLKKMSRQIKFRIPRI